MAKGIKSTKSIEVGDNLYVKKNTVVYLAIPNKDYTYLSRDVSSGDYLGIVKALVKEFEDDTLPSYIEIEDAYDTFYALYDNVLFEGRVNPDFLYPEADSLPTDNSNKALETAKAIFDYISVGLGIFRKKNTDTETDEIASRRKTITEDDEPTFWQKYGLFVIIGGAAAIIIGGIAYILNQRKKKPTTTSVVS